MKRAVLCLFLLGFLASGQAQKVIQLEETKVNFVPKVVMVNMNANGVELKVHEIYEGQFSQNPLKFLQENLDMKALIKTLEKEKFDSYTVSLKNRKGGIYAFYDKEGELVKTSQHFRDIVLPSPMRIYLVADYKGWSMTGNSYSAKSKKDVIISEEYRISLEKGREKQKIKIIPESKTSSKLAGLKSIFERK